MNAMNSKTKQWFANSSTQGNVVCLIWPFNMKCASCTAHSPQLPWSVSLFLLLVSFHTKEWDNNLWIKPKYKRNDLVTFRSGHVVSITAGLRGLTIVGMLAFSDLRLREEHLAVIGRAPTQWKSLLKSGILMWILLPTFIDGNTISILASLASPGYPLKGMCPLLLEIILLCSQEKEEPFLEFVWWYTEFCVSP